MHITPDRLSELMDGPFAALAETVSKAAKTVRTGGRALSPADCLRQYDPFAHAVNDPAARPDRLLEGERGGEVLPVNRLQLARQRQVVRSAVHFECGPDITTAPGGASPADLELCELTERVWRGEKLHYATEDIVETRMAETVCAELWHDYESPGFWDGTPLEGVTDMRPAHVLLCARNGDEIYPIWDGHGGLLALGRGYSAADPLTGERTRRFDLYAADATLLGKQSDGGAWEVERLPGRGFLPVVLHGQERPEWADVQPLADREEANLSNLADTNDYYGDPAMVVEGEAESLPAKGEVAKVIQVRPGPDGGRGSVSFAQPDAMVESKKLEMDTLRREMLDLTMTPDIGFSTMARLMGSGTSGIALRLLFMGPAMKGLRGRKRLAEMLARRNAVIMKFIDSYAPGRYARAALPAVRFADALPVDRGEQVRDTVAMVNAGLMSRRTAMSILGAVPDPEAELERIREEASSMDN